MTSIPLKINYTGFIHESKCNNSDTCKCTKENKHNIFKQNLCSYINTLYPNKFNFTNKRQKHKLEDLLEDILYIAETGIPYKKLRSKINFNSLYYHISFFIIKNTFKHFYGYLLYEYFKTNKAEKLKYQSIDSSFIVNKGANKEQVKRNVYMKGKNCLKLSIIVETNGIPISIVIETGNVHDSKIFTKNINELIYDPKSLKYKNNNRYKQYFLADADYDSRAIREELTSRGYKVFIPKNKRGTKIASKVSTKEEKRIYKKRMIVENMFSRIKQYRRLNNIYEKNVGSYKSYLYFTLSKIITTKMTI